MDLQLGVAVWQGSDEHGVVEVAGGLAVDGHDRQAAEVFAAGEFGGGQRRDRLRGAFFRFGQDVRRKSMRDGVLADDDFDVNPKGIWRAEDLDYAAPGGAARLREAGNFDFNGHSFERPAFVKPTFGIQL